MCSDSPLMIPHVYSSTVRLPPLVSPCLPWQNPLPSLLCISPQAGWVYLRDSRMWYCPWPVHTCNLHMIPPYAGCGSVAFPPTWGTLSQCYSTHWAEQQCGYLCLNPVLSSIPTGVGGLAGFCRALEGVSNSGVFQGIPLVSHSDVTSNVTDW